MLIHLKNVAACINLFAASISPGLAEHGAPQIFLGDDAILSTSHSAQATAAQYSPIVGHEHAIPFSQLLWLAQTTNDSLIACLDNCQENVYGTCMLNMVVPLQNNNPEGSQSGTTNVGSDVIEFCNLGKTICEANCNR
jgi:hypothetical protein